MTLHSLRLADFRCYRSLSLDLPVGLTLITGDNAQGKTSLLEAVCLLLRLQSPRTATPRELIRMGATGFGVAGRLGERELRHTLGPSGRHLVVDGEPCRRPGDYLSAAGLVVWMGNSDLELVHGPGEGRRRYLDFLGVQLYPEYRNALQACDKALRARNSLLRRDASPPWRQIDAWTTTLSAHAAVLSGLRRTLVQVLAPHAAAAHQAVSTAGESLALTYSPGSEEDLAAQLLRLRPDETRRRLTLAGPQRDDLILTINELPAARFASEGQQRTIALALKLAQPPLLHALRGSHPVLLLDDIFGELDPNRRNALLDALPPGAQKIITTTHLQWMHERIQPAALWHLSHGELSGT